METTKNSQQAWREILEKLNFNFFEIEDDDDSKGLIFYGSIVLSEDEDSDKQKVIFLRFSAYNKADLTSYPDGIIHDFYGTWEEVYNKVVEIRKNFIPDPPEEEGLNN